MIRRYILPQMAQVWTEHNKYAKWLDIELLALEAQAELGNVPPEVVADVEAKAGFDAERIEEIEAVTHHDVVAFLTNVNEHVGPNGKYIHYGMTSSDVLDTGLSLQMREAMDIILDEFRLLVRVLRDKAFEYRDTVMVGRTHGVHAEPITLGQKFAVWTFEAARDLARLERAREVISYGKLSGAVGGYTNLDPRVEEYVCAKLGLKPAEASSQVLQRDRHAEYLSSIAIAGCSLEKFATEVRGLQRTDTLELEEPFAKGQKGSSAMPHKRNPIISERIAGLARLLRANALAAMENVSLWHERDISHSSVERIIVPDSTMVLHYITVKFRGIMEGLQVYPDNMRANLERTGGLIFSERVLLALVGKGLTREEAYEVVQRNAMRAWSERVDFRTLLEADPDVARLLPGDELRACFDMESHLRNQKVIFDRLERLEI